MNPMCRLSRALKSPVAAAVLFLLTLSVGCATTQTYHLPLDPATAPATLSAVATVAEGMGYQVTRMAISDNVRYDKETWIYYTIAEHDIAMAVVVKTEADRPEERVQEAKAKGDEIWNKAIALQKQPPAPPAQRAATPPATPAP